MYNNILVPLDGSKRAERILPYVEDMAMRLEARIVLLQVVERETDRLRPHENLVEPSMNLQKRARQEAEEYLAGLKGEFREKGLQVRAFVEEGPIVRTIIQVAEREGVDLIAMASHGRGGLSRVFYGSVAAGVLQQVDRPLLVIRARQEQ